MNNEDSIFDIAIIGGGPAGMMAAISAAHNFRIACKRHLKSLWSTKYPSICIIEKNRNLGKKLLLTGNGRCNYTADLPIDEFIEKFGRRGRFFIEAFSEFSKDELVLFFKKRGVVPKYETADNNDNVIKIFPEKGNSLTILECLIRELEDLSVKMVFSFRAANISPAEEFVTGKRHVFCISSRDSTGKNAKPLFAERVIIATGGKTYKSTGSSGDGYTISERLGHQIIKPHPYLMPVLTTDKNSGNLAGISVSSVKLLLIHGKKTIAHSFGGILFTHKGISGPAAFKIGGLAYSVSSNLSLVPGSFYDTRSKTIQTQTTVPVKPGFLKLLIDFLPDKNQTEIMDLLERFKKAYPKKEAISLIKHIAPGIPMRLVKHLLLLSGISAQSKTSNILKTGLYALIKNIKEFSLEPIRPGDPDKALVTEGGISIKNINPKTMESKIIKGIYFAGEIIEIAGPEGGFNLQKAFSTGWLAGKSACASYTSILETSEYFLSFGQ